MVVKIKLNLIYVVLCVFLSAIILPSQVFSGTAQGSFATTNSPPDQPYDILLQNGFNAPSESDACTSGEDHDNDANMTTHMLNATINWETPDENNSDAVFYWFCLSSRQSGVDALSNESSETSNENCNLINYWSENKSFLLDDNSAGGTAGTGILITNTSGFDGNETDDDPFLHNVTYTESGTEIYGAIMSYDNQTANNHSDILLFNITITNDRARLADAANDFGLNLSRENGKPGETHDNTPDFNWSDATDTDDGSASGKCPKDNFTYVFSISNSSTFSHLFFSAVETSSDTNWSNRLGEGLGLSEPALIYWNSTDSTQIEDDVSGYFNVTYHTYINVTDGHNGSVNYQVTAAQSAVGAGQAIASTFDLVDQPPQVTDVFISDVTTAESQCNPSNNNTDTEIGCSLSPLAYDNISMSVLINVSDPDDDCDTNVTLDLMLCINSSTQNCRSGDNANFTFQLNHTDSVVRHTGTNASLCTFSFLANLTGSDGKTPPFYLEQGNYLFRVNASSQSGITAHSHEQTNFSFANGSWTFNSLTSVNYTGTVTVGDTTIDLGVFNPGETQYNMTNHGNVIVNLGWNTTNFTRDGETTRNMTVNGTNFIIDDDEDATSPEQDGSPNIPDLINFTNFTGSGELVYFNYTTGLQRCSDSSCSSPTLNETLPTHFHIRPPEGLGTGTFTATIAYFTESHDTQAQNEVGV